MDYTLAQMTAFLDAETHRDREHASLLLGVTAVACQGDKRSIERLQRELAASSTSWTFSRADASSTIYQALARCAEHIGG